MLHPFCAYPAVFIQCKTHFAADYERRDSSNLLDLCFMNDILSSEGDDDPSARQRLTLDQLTARYIERNNISKKSNHVIVPLTPKSEDDADGSFPRLADGDS